MTDQQPLFSPLQLAWLASALRDAESEHLWASDRAIIRRVCESLAQNLLEAGGLRDQRHKEAFLTAIFTPVEPINLDELAKCYESVIRNQEQPK